MAHTLQPGEIAPNFAAPDQYTTLHSLEDYAGQAVLVYFYPQDNTPGCTAEACSFRDAYSELKKYVQIIGVSGDTSESHAEFSTQYQLPFPLLADPEHTIIKAYGANGLLFPKRVSFLIDAQGIIQKVYPDVDVATHANEVLKDAKALKS